MPSKCSVAGCHVYAKDAQYKLYRVPVINRLTTGEKHKFLEIRRLRWLRNCDLPDTSSMLLVCGRHFLSGKPSEFQQSDNVDWVPTLHLPRSEQEKILCPSIATDVVTKQKHAVEKLVVSADSAPMLKPDDTTRSTFEFQPFQQTECDWLPTPNLPCFNSPEATLFPSYDSFASNDFVNPQLDPQKVSTLQHMRSASSNWKDEILCVSNDPSVSTCSTTNQTDQTLDQTQDKSTNDSMDTFGLTLLSLCALGEAVENSSSYSVEAYASTSGSNLSVDKVAQSIAAPLCTSSKEVATDDKFITDWSDIVGPSIKKSIFETHVSHVLNSSLVDNDDVQRAEENNIHNEDITDVASDLPFQHYFKSNNCTQTESCAENEIRNLQQKLEYYKKLSEKVPILKEKLTIAQNRSRLSVSSLEHDDKKCKYFTGIFNGRALRHIFNALIDDIPESQELSKEQILVLALRKLRLNEPFCSLGYLYDLSQTTIAEYFYETINAIYP
ncbi:uncharacterized protein LOC134216398 [Armigeres subalbatus]|uniref:uncharacterized protein LOC134216398 n=1 Tax=Armigeres subalbatus TaxID=124917 RepID=UPI002ED62835